MKSIIIFWAFMLLISCNSYESSYELGVEHLKKDQQLALEHFHNATRFNNNNFIKGKSYIYIGYIYYSNHNNIEALKNYEKASDLLTEHPLELGMSLRNMGMIYGEIGDIKNAELYTVKAISLYSGHPDWQAKAYNGLGWAYYQNAQYDKAMKCFAIAKENDTYKHKAFNNIGLVYIERDELDSAKHMFKTVINLNVDKVYLAQTNLSKVYLAQGELDSADYWVKKSFVPDNDQLQESYITMHKINTLKNGGDLDTSLKYAQFLNDKTKSIEDFEKLAAFHKVESARLKILIEEKERRDYAIAGLLFLLIFTLTYFLSKEFIRKSKMRRILEED